jgi:hypothetical protein
MTPLAVVARDDLPSAHHGVLAASASVNN